jgi:hypothetical protein
MSSQKVKFLNLLPCKNIFLTSWDQKRSMNTCNETYTVSSCSESVITFRWYWIMFALSMFGAFCISESSISVLAYLLHSPNNHQMPIIHSISSRNLRKGLCLLHVRTQLTRDGEMFIGRVFH